METRAVRVVMVAERKGVTAVQPADVGVEPLACGQDLDHRLPPGVGSRTGCEDSPMAASGHCDYAIGAMVKITYCNS